ncbi:hypothetical protein ACRYCC_17005 [Actinomadura scrupuli]|uniref:hypothetical protein n=1 Tax=Actinomadura scrupuli TaxID=559629 RepID=UPI003D96D6D9
MNTWCSPTRPAQAPDVTAGACPDVRGNVSGGFAGHPVSRRMWADRPVENAMFVHLGQVSLAASFKSLFELIVYLATAGGMPSWVVLVAELVMALASPLGHFVADKSTVGRNLTWMPLVGAVVVLAVLKPPAAVTFVEGLAGLVLLVFNALGNLVTALLAG